MKLHSVVVYPLPLPLHRLQPLDVSVYGPLKKHYSAAVNKWNLSHPGRRITIYDLPACFARSFYKAFSYDNIVQGFKSAGVFPLNSDIFTEEDFLPSTVFKPPQPPANLVNRSITDEEKQIPEDTVQQPDGAEASTSALPEDIMPLPRLAMDASKTGMMGKLGSARVLTSTPEKERLLELAAEKKKKDK